MYIADTEQTGTESYRHSSSERHHLQYHGKHMQRPEFLHFLKVKLNPSHSRLGKAARMVLVDSSGRIVGDGLYGNVISRCQVCTRAVKYEEARWCPLCHSFFCVHHISLHQPSCELRAKASHPRRFWDPDLLEEKPDRKAP